MSNNKQLIVVLTRSYAGRGAVNDEWTADWGFGADENYVEPQELKVESEERIKRLLRDLGVENSG